MNTDHTLTSENDHWLFLQLPQAMRQGYTYTVSIPKGIGADQESASVCFDVWNAQSEAIHVNIIGYSPAEQDHAADLYQWMGDGGQRDYSSWEGNKVYLYNVNTKKKQNVGKVKFWKKASAADQEAGGKNLVGTDVWNIDFQGTTPGRYRLVVEDVGTSPSATLSVAITTCALASPRILSTYGLFPVSHSLSLRLIPKVSPSIRLTSTPSVKSGATCIPMCGTNLTSNQPSSHASGSIACLATP